MKKKLRKLLKKELSNSKQAFSLVELSVSLIVIAVIVAALMPVISKRLTSSSSIKNRISSDCDGLYPDGYCAMCYVTPKSCVTCTRVCESHQYKNVSDCICEKCSTKYGDMNCVRCNSKRCLACGDGYYLDGNNRCVICPKGYYCYLDDRDVSRKEACPKGYYSNKEGSNQCSACNRSSETQTGNVATNTASINCSACGNGKYASVDAQGSACDNCPKGYYCPDGKKSPCPIGTANNSTNKSNLSDCVKCKASNTTVVGTYAQSVAKSTCSSCINGNYASIEGASRCEICPAGYYCPQGKKAPCPLGTANGLTGQSALGACINCTASTNTITGTIGTSVGLHSCIACTNGKYASINKQTTACTTCPAGYYCPQGKKIPCPLGHYCTSGSSTPLACSAGYYAGVNATSCIRCNAGYYSASAASTCSACGFGTTSAAGASGCVSCSTGCSSCSTNANNCLSCKDGYYIQGTSCQSCPAGYYCKNNTKTQCSENNYCPARSSAPTACKAGTHSEAGSKSESDCKNNFDCTFEYTSGKNTKTITGIKADNLCIMTSSHKSYYSSATENNLTWTPITEANIESLCTNPASQHFAVSAGSCSGATYYSKDVGKNGYTSTNYADSCRVTMLGCGILFTDKCHVDKAPCSNYYYKDYYFPVSSAGIGYINSTTISNTKTIFRVYSSEIHNSACGTNTSNINYKTTYYGASSGNSSCNAVCCDDWLWTQGMYTRFYLVNKNN